MSPVRELGSQVSVELLLHRNEAAGHVHAELQIGYTYVWPVNRENCSMC